MVEWITNNMESVLSILGAIYVLATAVAAVTPSDKDDTVLDKIGAFADRVGFKIKGK